MVVDTRSVRKSFGFFFLGIAVAVGMGSFLTELVSIVRAPEIYVYYFLVWVASFGIVFGTLRVRMRHIFPAILSRMKASITWPRRAKVVNGVSWAAPFASIGIFPALYQYFILLGIGLGNLSTYVLMRRYSAADNREQMLVGIIALAAIPVAFIVDTSIFAATQDTAVLLSRFLIAVAYGAGGLYAILLTRREAAVENQER